jgi:hypothetical protein
MAPTEVLHDVLPKCQIQVFTHRSVRMVERPMPVGLLSIYRFIQS